MKPDTVLHDVAYSWRLGGSFKRLLRCVAQGCLRTRQWVADTSVQKCFTLLLSIGPGQVSPGPAIRRRLPVERRNTLQRVLESVRGPARVL